MKALCKIISSFLFCVFLLASCTKDGGNSIKPVEQLAQYLTGGNGNRVWHIGQVYENRMQQQLTASQMQYTKTYTEIGTQSCMGSFTDSDGYSGKWALTSVTQLVEVITNNAAGDIRTEWLINQLDAHTLDIESTNNGKTTRIVFYAF